MDAGSLGLIGRKEGIHVITRPEMQFATTGGEKKNMVIKGGVEKRKTLFCGYTDGLVAICAQAI